MNDSVVTAIIPAFNSEESLLASVQSVLAQTTPCRIVIIDDGSTDNTRPIAEKLAAEHPNIRVLSQPNCGLANARNVGLAQVETEFVAFLDSDDLWDPTKTAKQLTIISGNDDIIAVGGTMRYFGDRGILRGTVGEMDLKESQKQLSRARLMPFPISSLLTRTNIANQVGGFDEFLRLAEDLYFVSRISRLGEVVTTGDEVGWYRLHSSSLSSRNYLELRRVTRIIQKKVDLEVQGEMRTWHEIEVPEPSACKRRRDFGAMCLRLSAVRYGNRDNFRAAGYFAIALLLAPRYSLTKLLRRVG